MWLLYVIAAVVVVVAAIAVWDARWRSSLPQPDFGKEETEPYAEDYDAKRAEAAKASQAAEFYAHLAEEQEARAEELIGESQEAAERAGLDDVRGRQTEQGA
jgi:hypothetical protein